MVYIISYDLNKPNKDYSNLYKALKSYSYMHYLDSTWFIRTYDSAKAIYKKLNPYIDKDDRIIIIQVQNNGSGQLPKDAWDWLNNSHF